MAALPLPSALLLVTPERAPQTRGVFRPLDLTCLSESLAPSPPPGSPRCLAQRSRLPSPPRSPPRSVAASPPLPGSSTSSIDDSDLSLDAESDKENAPDTVARLVGADLLYCTNIAHELAQLEEATAGSGERVTMPTVACGCSRHDQWLEPVALSAAGAAAMARLAADNRCDSGSGRARPRRKRTWVESVWGGGWDGMLAMPSEWMAGAGEGSMGDEAGGVARMVRRSGGSGKRVRLGAGKVHPFSENDCLFLSLLHTEEVYRFVAREQLVDAYALAQVALYFEALGEARRRRHVRRMYGARTFFHLLWLAFAMTDDFADGQQAIVVGAVARHKWVPGSQLVRSGAQFVTAYARHRKRYLDAVAAFHNDFLAVFFELGCRGWLSVVAIKAKAAVFAGHGFYFSTKARRPRVRGRQLAGGPVCSGSRVLARRARDDDDPLESMCQLNSTLGFGGSRRLLVGFGESECSVTVRGCRPGECYVAAEASASYAPPDPQAAAGPASIFASVEGVKGAAMVWNSRGLHFKPSGSEFSFSYTTVSCAEYYGRRGYLHPQDCSAAVEALGLLVAGLPVACDELF
ncbi:uncharacterized protein AMSG_09952 [Thecamonas trahens ATCC 50062]|uniref:Uncharacterized protein n=1 Tax=Thecamonas trahens ATCC 50062 TaxID=461836 RepID=A0A0L0DRW4_THETB|nr:hypothetical protein AMSG_09952 [Thecamonas trahens ATCC 50062]KNC54168.1 hypothetical protein AMSG_09952 [Thecamonas trahens ATCC 50062]|eukprot:XP_013753986.1 hypothetical protein AMSG_09952 [Thecamonas trahens ATCC 50062]